MHRQAIPLAPTGICLDKKASASNFPDFEATSKSKGAHPEPSRKVGLIRPFSCVNRTGGGQKKRTLAEEAEDDTESMKDLLDGNDGEDSTESCLNFINGPPESSHTYF